MFYAFQVFRAIINNGVLALNIAEMLSFVYIYRTTKDVLQMYNLPNESKVERDDSSISLGY